MKKISLIFSLLISLNCQTIQTDFSDLNELKYKDFDYDRVFEGYGDSIIFKPSKAIFSCSRYVYNSRELLPIGRGHIQGTKKGLKLVNKDCDIRPPFKELLCVIEDNDITNPFVTLRCKSATGLEYTFIGGDK